ncbi:MAG: DUF1501 domain-containing protein [Burkholderiales bacterium]|jgi:uncharacterized protein (DUF1501 family)
MRSHAPNSAARRHFLSRARALGVAGAASGWAMNLAAIGEAAAFDATDYKALVCVFLYGGNDFHNTIVPYDSASHTAYSTIRGGTTGIAIDRTALAASALVPTVALPGGRQYALAPGMAPLLPLFDAGKMAVQLNVGPLVQPVTRAQYDARNVPLPPKLFSHNDQQSVWQASAPEGATVGWGGKMGDLALSSNAGASLFTCISATGQSVMLSGSQALAYQIGTGGATAINGAKNAFAGSTAVRDAVNELMKRTGTHLMEADYAAVVTRSQTAEQTVTAALAGVPASGFTRFDPTVNTALATQLTGNTLADQMRIVARLIAARSTLGTKRQVFLVSLGGFDHHDYLMTQHPTQIGRVAAAMRAFHDTTVDLGVADRVVAFTASDFGRTLTSNGDGSDHGWGSHHWLVGGPVAGRAIYGTAPPIEVNGTQDVGSGRLIPTTSVDQYGASLASWFGVAAGELSTVFPNIGNFSGRPAFL